MTKKRAKTLDVHVGYRIPSALHKSLMRLAIKQKTSQSATVRAVLEAGLRSIQQG